MAMRHRGYRTRTDLASAAEVSVATVGNVLAGRGVESRQAIEDALRWEAGSIREVLSGGDPTMQDGPQHEGDQPPQRRRADRADVIAAIENDNLLVIEAKKHLLNQYRLLIRLRPNEELSQDADRLDLVAHGVDPADREAVHRLAQQVRQDYEEKERERRTRGEGGMGMNRDV